jgi:hypothetical protein
VPASLGDCLGALGAALTGCDPTDDPSSETPWLLRRGGSQDRAARCDFHGGNPPCVEHQKPIAVPAAQHAAIFRKRGDAVVDDLVLATRAGLLVRQIQVVTADEPNTKHDACHAHAH